MKVPSTYLNVFAVVPQFFLSFLRLKFLAHFFFFLMPHSFERPDLSPVRVTPFLFDEAQKLCIYCHSRAIVLHLPSVAVSRVSHTVPLLSPSLLTIECREHCTLYSSSPGPKTPPAGQSYPPRFFLSGTREPPLTKQLTLFLVFLPVLYSRLSIRSWSRE